LTDSRLWQTLMTYLCELKARVSGNHISFFLVLGSLAHT
jgi:hypothetical protein